MYVSSSTTSKIVTDCRLDNVDSLGCPFTDVLRLGGIIGAVDVLGAVSIIGAVIIVGASSLCCCWISSS